MHNYRWKKLNNTNALGKFITVPVHAYMKSELPPFNLMGYSINNLQKKLINITDNLLLSIIDLVNRGLNGVVERPWNIIYCFKHRSRCVIKKGSFFNRHRLQESS